MEVRLAQKLTFDSIVDGDGLRMVVWMQGCSHACPGCHNPSTHDFNEGFMYDLEDLKRDILSVPNQDGITLSGGDPLFQPKASYEIAKFSKENGLSVWLWTGFTFEELMVKAKYNHYIMKLLENVDVLVDGRFEIDKKSMNFKYRGSYNQRIIDVKKSLECGRPVIIEKYNKIQTYQKLYQSEEYIFV